VLATVAGLLSEARIQLVNKGSSTTKGRAICGKIVVCVMMMNPSFQLLHMNSG